jgi:hypothetical protein
MIRHPVPHEGRIAIVTDVGRDAVDAAALGALSDRRAGFPVSDQGAQDERRFCGRQNRVVLAPVAGVKSAEVKRARPGFKNLESAGDGDNTNSSPGSNCILK